MLKTPEAVSKKSWLLVAAGAAVIIVSLLSGHHLPLYDGVSAPDEPYRYVRPPSLDLRTAQPPSTAQLTTAAYNGQNSSYVYVASQEFGPQIALYILAQSLTANPSATSLTITAVPKAPDTDQPAEGAIAGNFYSFSATSNAGAARFTGTSKNPDYIDLRLPQGYSGPATVVYRAKPDGPWSAFVTNQVGNDIYEAPLVGFGDYALVVKSTKTAATHHAPTALIIVLVILLLVVASIIGLIRYGAAKERTHGSKKTRRKA